MRKIYLSVIAIAVGVIAGLNVNLSSNDKQLSLMELANVNALAQGESSGGYCVMHLACFDSKGNKTGNYSASSYSGPGCSKAYHSHSCSSCDK